jgi:putative cell wall-binding protein
VEIKRLQAKKAVILGGPGAVSQGVEQSLKDMGLEVERISGTDRYGTAALISGKAAPQGAETAVVVYGMNFPDALSVSSYAAAKGMPVLLTDTNSIPQATLDAIHDLKVKNTLVVGGSGVISDDVLNKLPGAIRLGGADRYATSMKIASYFNSNAQKIYIATGLNFADAVSGAVLAGKENTGILLVDGKRTTGNILPEGLDKFIHDKGITGLTALGGYGAVNYDTSIKLKELLK